MDYFTKNSFVNNNDESRQQSPVSRDEAVRSHGLVFDKR